jgi:hypothetical protein
MVSIKIRLLLVGKNFCNVQNFITVFFFILFSLSIVFVEKSGYSRNVLH